MLSKWERFYSKDSANRFQRESKRSLCLLSFLALSWVLVPGFAWGQLLVRPFNGGSLSPNMTGPGFFYYFVKAPGTTGVPPQGAFSSIQVLDISKTLANDAGASPFIFELTTNATYSITGTQQAVVTVQIGAVNTTTPRFAPIARVNDNVCNQTFCQSLNIHDSRANYYYAAKFAPKTNNKVRIGLYLEDICKDYGGGQAVTGCGPTGTGVLAPTVGTPTSLPVTFSVYVLPDGNPATIPTGTPIDTNVGAINLRLQVETGISECSNNPPLPQSYFVQDKSILFNPSAVGFRTCATCAPAGFVHVVGNDNAVPNVGPGFEQANSVQGKLIPGSNPQVVGGFINSVVNGEDHIYDLAFIVAEQTGIYVPAPASCRLTGIKTYDVLGYLSKSNCFIATAAFGSGESPPVMMLREFRDKVLLKFSVGQAFVSWYYSWSPGVADWLIERPLLRIPVLLMLAPLELFAWLLLHPVIAGSGIILGFLILGWVVVFSLNSKPRNEMGS